ncbi:hypothetical protein PG996_008953 [Apiospora saccharicola]|uniref:Uncharacterized protein n=1 Tax=Apiospora saccharicola TaxID=335842 RepID=A0ABR1UZE6_9PEZI
MTAAASSLASNSTPHNATLPAWEVICAWPVSGQYGPGSRYLYYALVAACVLARKSEWLRNACLAAGLLFPAIAAFHGIVLTAMHNNGQSFGRSWIDMMIADTGDYLGAVDMDVYGAFQLCTIGILAAPVTVRWSKTYFYDPARNLIFLWTALILAGELVATPFPMPTPCQPQKYAEVQSLTETCQGLLSLTVEFYRIEPVECTQDGGGNVLSPVTNQTFPYESGACSNIPCSVGGGPWSSLRQGSTNEIFIIPAPQKLTFGAATLLAAACCIPAILSMVSMWNKILEINWKRRFGQRNNTSNAEQARQNEDEEVIEGTNGATVGKMNNVNEIIRQFLSVVQIPVFVGAVLAIMVIGELNFWSESVNYQTEPVTSIGQWAPIIGTVLAALGSLYVAWDMTPQQSRAAPADAGGRLDEPNGQHDNSSPHGLNSRQNTTVADESHVHSFPRNSREAPSAHLMTHDSPILRMTDSPEMVEARRIMSNQSTSPDLHRYMSNNTTNNGDEEEGGRPADAGGRRKVAQIFGDLGRYMGTPAPDLFDDSEFRRGRAMDFPEIPGEAVRNPDLEQIRSQYNQPHDSDEDEVTPPPLGRSRSRAESFIEGYDAMGISSISRSASPSRVQSLSRSRSRPPPSPGIATRASTMPVVRTPHNSPPQSPTTDIRDGRPRRRETLEVPSPVRPQITSWSNTLPTTTQNFTSTEEAPNSERIPPTIVISPDSGAGPSRLPATSIVDPTVEPPKPARDPSG